MASLAPGLLARVTEFGYMEKWHLQYAKFNRQYHQSLLSHAINVGVLSVKLADLVIHGRLADKERDEIVKAWNSGELVDLVFLAGFLHDYGKSKERFQNSVRVNLAGERASSTGFAHQMPSVVLEGLGKIREYLERQGYQRGDRFWDDIRYCISNLGEIDNAESASFLFQTRPQIHSQLVIDVVHSADVLLSKTLDEIASSRKLFDGRYTESLDVWFTRVSTVRGVATQVLLLSLEELVKERGYEPLAWHQDGTVYCFRKGSAVPTLEQDFAARVAQKLRQIVFADPSKLAKASFGGLQEQVITEPIFLFYSDEVVRQFWKQRFYEYRRELNSKKSAKTDYFEKEDLDRQGREKLAGELGITVSELHERLRRFKEFDFKVFITLMGIEKQVRESVKQDAEIAEIIQNVYSKLDVQPPNVKPSNTMKREIRLEFAKTVWKSRFYTNPVEWEDKLHGAMLEATLRLKEVFRKAQDPEKFLEHIAHLLVNDITEPSPPGSFNKLKRSYEDYLDGKKRGTPLCVICSGPAELTAVAKVLGESEIYHDSLVAGSEIGGENKLRICELCDFEYKVRRLLMVDFRDTYAFVIVPHIAISRESSLYWKTLADRLVRDNFAPIKLDEVEFLEQVLGSEDAFKGTIQDVWLSYLSGSPVNTDIQSVVNDKPSLGAFADALQALIVRYGDPSPLLEEIPKDVDISSIEEAQALISLLKQGKVRLAEGRLQEVFELMRRVKPICYTGNYVLIFAERMQSWGDGATGKLKWLLYQTILGRLFLATILDVTTSVVLNEGKKGYAKFPSDVIFKDFSRKLSVNEGWITIDGLEKALSKLSALVLVERLLVKAGADYGKDSLLRILSAEPGKVVARYVQYVNMNKSKQDLRELIHALERLGGGE
ncbi:hypothetical protein B9Q03_08190 [Candidatus Marsarchaeota G2 archaeon OSP_D]|jgi:hypothetical protein|uniref:HD/PDEase domain-containing protein n=1 Tax=Candidatus Marsarchaeota G2 archaeon OSP_D TaxID=1978157 RepID=A0A2R6ATS7_9ARCH|nr:MAG: hypothetical protein B9Q03_08190 [Candidatus Marsarchaeota G2 archaeon OSP_D]